MEDTGGNFRMKNMATITRLTIFLFTCTFAVAAWSAPACKGPNKNDPGCAESQALAGSATVDSVTVDWLNQKLVVRGSGFADTTEFLLGGGATPLTKANLTDTQLDLPFNGDVAAEVLMPGDYNLFVDGAMQLTVYMKSQVIDPAASGCTCSGDWAILLPGSLYTDRVTDCLEIAGTGTNDIADISGTILSDVNDAGVYPQYPIGASFYPGDPENSVCRLVQIDPDATVEDLLTVRINESQQADCAIELKSNVCLTVNGQP